jgi:transposase
MLLYTTNPELLSYCQTGVPAWVLKLSAQYPSAAKLKKAQIRSVANIPYITPKRARQLIDDAKTSVASTTDVITEQLVAATALQIVALSKTIVGQENRMIIDCNLPEVELLKSFIGIGDKSAIGLVIEIQTVKRFANVKKLSSFFGIHPVYKISGDGIGAMKMSKQGRSRPRKTLYMVSLSAIEKNPLIKQFYEKQQEKGKHNMAAMGICMHKILRIIYGMLKHNKPFNPQIDIADTHKVSRPEKPFREKIRVGVFKLMTKKLLSPDADGKKDWNKMSPKVSPTLSPGSSHPFQSVTL